MNDVIDNADLNAAAGVVAGLAAAGLAAGFAACAPMIVRGLCPPADVEPGWSYRAAAGRWLIPATRVASAAALLMGFWLAPVPARPAWAVLGTLGVLLGVIDARTGYLPKRLCWVATGLAAAGVGIGAAAWGGWQLAANAAAGSALAGAVMWLVWRRSHGLGFGDVRLAILIGAVAGTGGALQALWAIAAGALLAVGAGTVRQLAGRRDGPYPYGPFLVAGPFIVLLL